METTQTQAPSNNRTLDEYSRRKDCPDCGNHSVSRSTTCLSDMLEKHVGVSPDIDHSYPGELCTNDDCVWFMLDRDSAPDRALPVADKDQSIHLSDHHQISKHHEDVTLNGATAKYRAENKCPECASDVIVKLRRFTNDDREIYKPVYEECVNYGRVGNGCPFKRGDESP
jgi:predicted RNA-binding Zn-ribbon protein involved in translation (DUF1610 family)